MATEEINIDKLVNFDWKFGLASSSDSCKNLNQPFVCVNLTIKETSGVLKTKSVEMTIPEFQDFSSQMKKMATILETV